MRHKSKEEFKIKERDEQGVRFRKPESGFSKLCMNVREELRKKRIKNIIRNRKSCFNSWPATISDLCITQKLALVSWACSCIAINREQNFYALAFIMFLCWTPKLTCLLQLS